MHGSTSTAQRARARRRAGGAWFVGKDVATILGCKDASDALRRHVDKECRQNLRNAGFDSPRGMAIIKIMHMETIESAIAVIRNSGRILLTWDDGWDCWLLPNRTIHEPDTPGHALRSLAIDYLPCMRTRLCGMPPTLMVDSRKPCPQHDGAIRHYVYTIGFYDIHPDADYGCGDVCDHHLVDIDGWRGECGFHGVDHFVFDIGVEPDRRTCTWWTVDEMRADRRMRAVNGDLIGTLELVGAGLPPTGPVPAGTGFDRACARPRP